MRVIEFKLSLTQEQERTLDRWLNTLCSIWNKGLSLLEEEQQRRWRKKAGLDPMEGKEQWIATRNPKRHFWMSEDQKSLFEGEYGFACPIGYWHRREQVFKYCCNLRENMDVEEPGRMAILFQGDKYNDDRPDIKEICSRFRGNCTQTLRKAWKNYQSPNTQTRKPRYRSKKNNPIQSLINANASKPIPGSGFRQWDTVRIDLDHNRIRFPRIGWLKVIHFNRRWYADWVANVATIIKKRSGYYLQLTLDKDRDYKVSHPDKAIGIDPGIVHAITLSNGKCFDSPFYLKKAEKRLAMLQRKAAHMKKGSQNWKKMQQRIAKLHEKIANQRRLWNHKITTQLITTYGGICWEDNSFEQMGRRPRPKKRENGAGYESNGAKQKSKLNKRLKDVASGQAKQMLEAKTRNLPSEFIKTSSHNGSRICCICGHEHPKSPPDRTFTCSNCKAKMDVDLNSAILALQRAAFNGDFAFEVPSSLPVGRGTDVSSRNPVRSH